MMLPRPKLLEIENRGHKRHSCHWPAVLFTDNFNRSCVIEDISNGGCRLLVNTGKLTSGSTVKIQVPARKLSFTGKIVWLHCEEAGIKFTSKPARL
ncbi:PilZ domain-containing protein [Pseudovibrio denitrificans]|nr:MULTISPECIES: PilZ domain-containing protein [Pseudovibrio]